MPVQRVGWRQASCSLPLLYFLKTSSFNKPETHHLTGLAGQQVSSTLLSWSPLQELQAQTTIPSLLRDGVWIAACYSVLCSELRAVWQFYLNSPFTGFIFGAVVFLFSCVSSDSVSSLLSSCVCTSPHFSGLIFRFFFSELFPQVFCVSEVAYSAFLMFCSL